MSNDARDLARRSRAIAPPETLRSAGSVGSQGYPPYAPRVVGVIHDVDVLGGFMYWQRIRYQRGQPQRGRYERYGRIEEGWPYETALIEDYAIWRWGHEEVTTRTVPIAATFRNGYWIIEVPFKPDGSALDGTVIPAGCGQG